MSELKDKGVVIDAEIPFPGFNDPKWVAAMREKYAVKSEDNTEMSVRARKKKRIYKRKKAEKKDASIS
jgi:hypothetical protein